LRSEVDVELNPLRANARTRAPKSTSSLTIDNLIGACTQKLQSDPSHEKALIIRASNFIKRNQLEEAIADCNRLLELNRENSSAFYVRGTAYNKMGHI
jgi:Flp pilus assembly protein TadD